MRFVKLRTKFYEFNGRFRYRLKPQDVWPVFIVGTGRCGTTLLFRILRSHPKINAYPTEANDLWHPSLFPYQKRTVESPPFFIDPHKFTSISLQSWSAKHRARILYTLGGFHYLEGPNKLLLICSAMISFLISEIFSLFPKAKIIHIYRSGPSVVASFFKKEHAKYSTLLPNKDSFMMQGAKYWNESVMAIENFTKNNIDAYDDRILEIRYEDLCEHQDHTIADIANFLNIDQQAFTFDFTQIRNMNYKVGNFLDDPQWAPLLEQMREGMDRKGYNR